jgi:hypothetical protein
VTILVFIELLAASVWIGGFVAIGVAARVARAQLEPADRVAFFRALGRTYLGFGGVALVVALVSGGALLASGPWTTAKSVAVVLGVCLAAVTVAGVLQARAITVLRQEQLRNPNGLLGGRIGRQESRATVLRAAIGLLTIVLLVVATMIVS